MNWLRQYRIRLLREQITDLEAQEHVWRATVEGVGETNSYFIRHYAELLGKIARLKARLSGMEESCS